MPLISSGFSTLERLGSKPRELYSFARGQQTWRYTSAGSPVVVNWSGTNITYTPALIKRDRVQRGQDSAATRVKVRIGRTVPVAIALSEQRTMPTYLGIHRQQDDPSSTPILVAYGSVGAITFVDGWVEVDLITADAGLSQPFPRILFERTCPLATYGQRCGVKEADFSFETTIVAVERSKITVASVNSNPDGYYNAGQIKLGPLATNLGAERVSVSTQVGVDLFILGLLPDGYGPSDTVTLIAGDDHSLATCRDRFNNVRNFLGFDNLPVTDPFQTGFI